MTPENRARVIIDRLLRQSGWDFEEEAIAEGNEERGFADYLMKDPNGLVDDHH